MQSPDLTEMKVDSSCYADDEEKGTMQAILNFSGSAAFFSELFQHHYSKQGWSSEGKSETNLGSELVEQYKKYKKLIPKF